VFGQRAEYPVWARFSSDVQPGVPDVGGTAGVAMKLFGVAGDKLLAPDQQSATHDFILQNHDVFFVDAAKDMCEFTCEALHGRVDEYLAKHSTTKQILDDMRKVVESVAAVPYWSVLPSRFGADRFVKYKLEPEDAAPGEAPSIDDPFYLRADLHSRLRRGEIRFRFCVQFQRDESTMPLDRATVRWSETDSPPVHVATLILPQQDADARGQSEYGEALAFNPWRALAEHAPTGSVAEARRVVYAASAANRRNVNGQPTGEPTDPRPAEWRPGTPYPAARDTRVMRAAIHPAIGIARVGNSAAEYAIGPQIVPAPPAALGTYRDAQGALKRQAAEFRIYGYNASGEVVRELTADSADVRWTVHVANTKAAWYQWQIALDIPEAARVAVPRRNASVVDRTGLVIDGGSRTIAGKSTSGSAYVFEGAFQGVPVYLGELRTDAVGRLLFLGGRGVSASPTNSPIYNDKDPNGFINADGWYDDVSDGPVTASVSIEGRDVPVEPAWVVTAPPNFAPDVLGVRTLYDLLVDLYVQAGWMKPPGRVSFRRDVYPLLRRLAGLQWVNQGFATQFGPGGPNDFTNPEYVAKLARDPAAGGVDLYGELRQQVLNCFRPPTPADGNQLPWPWLYGDAMDVPAGTSPRQNASISATQRDMLAAWAARNFDSDWGGSPQMPKTIGDVPLAEQPVMLDRAALEYCLADAFHPGCEVTWPVRHLMLYSSPFRIRHRAAGVPGAAYGKKLDQATALSVHGPLHEQGPGDLTRWMGLPWQADTAWCRAGYDMEYDPFQPTFWPARVPNHVLTETDYARAIDGNQPRHQRLEAFATRISWTQPLHGDTAQQMEAMVRIFGSMGLVESRPGVPNDPLLPPTMLVASYGPDVPPRDRGEPSAAEAPRAAARVAAPRRTIQRTNFTSPEEARVAPRPVRHEPG
jgi:hypothetical protein